MTRGQEINQAMLARFARNGVADTPDNRIAFLEEVRDATPDRQDDCLDKRLYMVTLLCELSQLKVRHKFAR